LYFSRQLTLKFTFKVNGLSLLELSVLLFFPWQMTLKLTFKVNEFHGNLFLEESPYEDTNKKK
jgi:hypothetical protein